MLLEHLETFLARIREHDSGHGRPRFVEREPYRHLRCGILAFGLAALAAWPAARACAC